MSAARSPASLDDDGEDPPEDDVEEASATPSRATAQGDDAAWDEDEAESEAQAAPAAAEADEVDAVADEADGNAAGSEEDVDVAVDEAALDAEEEVEEDAAADVADGADAAPSEDGADCDMQGQEATAFLERYCAQCHGPGTALAFDYRTDALLQSGKLVAGNSDSSPLLSRVVSGNMPPPSVATRPAAEEIDAFALWVDSCL